MIRLIAITIAIGLLAALPVDAERRTAFVVGNSDYANAARLANPVRDARLVGDTLTDLGFDVTRHSDLSRSGFSRALGEFLKNTSDADVTVFYFAGHGMQFDGRNYLVGTDAKLQTEFDIEGETIALDKVVAALERNSKGTLIFIDACRDNPLATDFYRRNYSETRALNTRGLARVQSRIDGSMLVFAAAPGQVAYDGNGVNSPFAEALARHLPTANTEVLSLTKRIIGDVRKATDGAQSPIVTNDLTREIFLREAAMRPASDATEEVPSAVSSAFDSAKRIGTIRNWIQFIQSNPNSSLTANAERELESTIEREANAVVVERPKAAGALLNKIARELEEIIDLSEVDRIAAQALIERLGYQAGGIDGTFGERSRAAIRSFQADNGIPETGLLTPMTAKALGLTIDYNTASDRLNTSTFISRHVSPRVIDAVETDPRIGKAARVLDTQKMIYGYFGDQAYVAVTLRFAGSLGAISTENARYMAQAMGGYLARIDSDAEREFVANLVSYDPAYSRGKAFSGDRLLWDRFVPITGETREGQSSSAYIVEIDP